MKRERSAVENKLVLPAKLVAVDQRQSGLDHTRNNHLQTVLRPVFPVGRAIGNQQQLRAGFLQTLANLVVPDILADRQADAHTAEVDRSGQGAGSKNPFLVKDAIVGQVVLVANGLYLALVQQQGCVIDFAFLAPPGRPQHDARTAICGFNGKGFGRFHAVPDESRFQNKVFRQIPGEHQFGGQDKVCPLRGGFLTGLANELCVAGHIANSRV